MLQRKPGGDMLITCDHSIQYITSKPVRITDVIRTLRSTERTVRQMGRVIEALYPDIEVSSARARVSHISQNSPLDENYVFEFIVKVRDDLERGLKDLGDFTGIDVLINRSRGLSNLLTVMLLFGAMYVMSLIFSEDSAIHIEGEHNTLIQITANDLSVSPEAITGAIRKALSERQQRDLAKEAADYFAPSKVSGSDGVLINGKTRISQKSIDQIPSVGQIERLNEAITTAAVTRAVVRIRASDRDSATRGWAAVVPQIAQDRLPLHIGPFIDLRALANREEAVADLLVVYQAEDGEARPIGYHLLNLHSDQKPPS